MWYHPNCAGGGDWEKEGWWSLTYGESKIVYGDDLEDLNRYYCFYAEGTDGSVWDGPYTREVTNNVFDQCEWDTGGDSRNIGFRLLDIGDNDDYNVNLVPFGYRPPPPPSGGGGGGGWGGGGGGDDDGDDDDGDTGDSGDSGDDG